MAKLSFGSCYFSTPASTTLSAATPAKAAGTTTSMQLADFTMPANNRLTYTATDTRTFQAMFTGSASKASGGSALSAGYIAKNGSVITGSQVQRQLANTSDIGAGAVSAQFTLAQNDYIEFWVETDNGDDLTIEAGVLSVHVIG